MLETIQGAGVVLVAMAVAVLLPGMLLTLPFLTGGKSPPALRAVLGYVCGYASFTVFADLLTRLAGTNLFTLLVGPAALSFLLALLPCLFPPRNGAVRLPTGLDLTPWQLIACGAFACLVIAQVAPVSAGGRVYWGYPYLDYTKHVAVTHAVARTGSPPMNPTYAPFGDRHLFYYFGYYLFPGALVRYFGVGAVPAFLTCATLTAACFTAVCMSLGNYLVGSRRGGWLTLALCLVTGLDIIPVSLLEANGMTFREIEWWNPGQVTAITGFLVWVPQHSAAALDVLVALLLLGASDTDTLSPWRDWRLVPIVLLTAACAMTSTFVAEGLFASLGAHSLFYLFRLLSGAHAGTRSLVTLVASLLLVLPFYGHLHAIDRYEGPSQLPVFRPFAWEDTGAGLDFFHWFDRFQPVFGGREAYRLFTLPLQYTLEFGFWAIVGVWWATRGRSEPGSDPTFCRMRFMAGCSLLIASVFASVRTAPVLNWRVLLPLQGVLTAAGAAFLLHPDRGGKWRHLLLQAVVLAALYLGVLGTLYDAYNLRFSLTDPSDPDPALVGRASLAASQIEALTEPTARVQYNPTHNPPWLIYLNRPFPISDSGFNSATFGVSEAEHAVVLPEVTSIFGDGLSAAEREQLVVRYQIDYLLVQKEDPIFGRPLMDLFAHSPPVVCVSGEWILLDTSTLRRAFPQTHGGNTAKMEGADGQ